MRVWTSLNTKINSSDIYDMLVKMSHRGPDSHGVYLDGKLIRAKEINELTEQFSRETHIALGHSRLTIIGKEGLTQPYRSSFL